MEGFQIPIHRSLTQQIMLAGVPREIALLNGTLTCALVFGLHSFLGIPVGIVVHVISQNVAKNDPQFFQTFKRQIKHKKYYF